MYLFILYEDYKKENVIFVGFFKSQINLIKYSNYFVRYGDFQICNKQANFCPKTGLFDIIKF